MRRRDDKRSGQMIIFMTLSLFALFSMLGLSVDLGYSYFVKVFAQTAADSAAAAAAIYANTNGYVCGSSVTCNSTYTCPSNLTTASDPLQAGCLYAAQNGFKTTGSQTVAMIANNTVPPGTTGVTPALWIKATVSQSIPHTFLYWAGFHSGSVATQAMSGVNVVPNSGCTYVTDTAATQDAFVISGSGSLSAAGCGVFVNSSNSTKALDITGKGSITASQITVRGGVTCPVGKCTPTPTTGAAITPDPFNLTPPAVGSCSFGTSTTPYATSVSASINPGVYCGGITVTGGTLTLASGIYILNGGGISVSGQGYLAGSHVMFFLTGQGGHTPGPMLIQGNGINLSAPDGGPYQGILFYQDPNQTYGSQNVVSGSATISGSGTFYFPTTTLSFSGGSGTNATIAFVVHDLAVSGNAVVTEDITGTLTGLVKRTPGLIQ